MLAQRGLEDLPRLLSAGSGRWRQRRGAVTIDLKQASQLSTAWSGSQFIWPEQVRTLAIEGLLHAQAYYFAGSSEGIVQS